MFALLTEISCESGNDKSIFCRGIALVSFPSKRGQLFSSALPDGLYKRIIRMIYKIMKGRNFSILFSHKYLRNIGREKNNTSCELKFFKRLGLAQAVALRPVADLVMTLREDDKPEGWAVFRAVSMLSFPECRVLTGIDKAFPECLHKVFHFSEIFVIPIVFAGQYGMEGVVKIIVPLRVQTIAADILRINDPHIIEVALGNHKQVFPGSLCLGTHSLTQLREKMPGSEVEHPMDGIDCNASIWYSLIQ